MERLLFLFSVLLASTSIAQVGEGTKFMSGSLSATFSTATNPLGGQNSYTSKGINLSIRPSAGVFISETSALGAGIFYNFSYDHSILRSYFQEISTGTSHGPGLELFFRKYKFMGERFALYLNADIQGDYSTRTSTSETVDSLGVVISSGSGG